MVKKIDGKTIATNKKAYHDYFIEETYEAGIELFGTEVKSLRNGAVNLKDSYCTIEKGELYAVGIHISPYEKGNVFNREPLRDKKLLMHKKEILKLLGAVGREGLTIIPLSLYFSGSRVRLDFAKVKSFTIREKPMQKDRLFAILKGQQRKNTLYNFFVLE